MVRRDDRCAIVHRRVHDAGGVVRPRRDVPRRAGEVRCSFKSLLSHSQAEHFLQLVSPAAAVRLAVGCVVGCTGGTKAAGSAVPTRPKTRIEHQDASAAVCLRDRRPRTGIRLAISRRTLLLSTAGSVSGCGHQPATAARPRECNRVFGRVQARQQLIIHSPTNGPVMIRWPPRRQGYL